MPTCAWSTPACGTSSTKRATSRRLPASYHVHPQTGLGELRNRGYGTGDGRKSETPAERTLGNADSLSSPRRFRRFALRPWPLWSVDVKFGPGRVLKFAHGSSQRRINLVARVSTWTPGVLVDNTLRVIKSAKHVSACLIGSFRFQYKKNHSRAIARGSQSLVYITKARLAI